MKLEQLREMIDNQRKNFIYIPAKDFKALLKVAEAAKKWRENHLSKDEVALYKTIDDLERAE